MNGNFLNVLKSVATPTHHFSTQLTLISLLIFPKFTLNIPNLHSNIHQYMQIFVPYAPCFTQSCPIIYLHYLHNLFSLIKSAAKYSIITFHSTLNLPQTLPQISFQHYSIDQFSTTKKS